MLPSLLKLVPIGFEKSIPWEGGDLTKIRIGDDIPFAGEVKALCAVIPKWHTYSRDLVQHLEAIERLSCGCYVPQTKLTVTHLGESGSCDPI